MVISVVAVALLVVLTTTVTMRRVVVSAVLRVVATVIAVVSTVASPVATLIAVPLLAQKAVVWVVVVKTAALLLHAVTATAMAASQGLAMLAAVALHRAATLALPVATTLRGATLRRASLHSPSLQVLAVVASLLLPTTLASVPHVRHADPRCPSGWLPGLDGCVRNSFVKGLAPKGASPFSSGLVRARCHSAVLAASTIISAGGICCVFFLFSSR